jgi:hypothetical protein
VRRMHRCDSSENKHAVYSLPIQHVPKKAP